MTHEIDVTGRNPDMPIFSLEEAVAPVQGLVMPRFALDDFRSGGEDISTFLLHTGHVRGADSQWANDLLTRSEASEAQKKARRRAGKPERPTFYGLDPRPFKFIDPTTIPRRQWLYGTHYARRFVSTTVAPGGVGKSSLVMAEALSIASGQPLLGVTPSEPVGVWYFNLEDPLEELQRRMMATALHYGLKPDDVAFTDNLFVNSGRDQELVIATQTKGETTISKPSVEALKAAIEANGIGVLIVDPFVSSHRVSENDNNAIDVVTKTWARIADECNCAIELVHHVRKTNGSEVTVEDGRGASSLLAAARSGRVLNPMSQDEADRACIKVRRLYFRVDNGKANMAPPADHSTWYTMVSQRLPNGSAEALTDDGDSVGVCAPWSWPDPLDDFSVADLRAAQSAVSKGSFRENVQASNWAGHTIGAALGLDTRKSKADRTRINQALRRWIDNGMFEIVERKDESSRKQVNFIVVGEPADD